MHRSSVLFVLLAVAPQLVRVAATSVAKPDTAVALEVSADGGLSAEPIRKGTDVSNSVVRRERPREQAAQLLQPALDLESDASLAAYAERVEFVRTMQEASGIDDDDDDEAGNDHNPVEEKAEQRGPTPCEDIMGKGRVNLREGDTKTWCPNLRSKEDCDKGYEHLNGVVAICKWNAAEHKCRGVMSGSTPWSCGCPGIPAASALVCGLFTDKTALDVRTGAKPRWCSQTSCDGALECTRYYTLSKHGRYVKCAWDAHLMRCRGLGFSGAQQACCDHAYVAGPKNLTDKAVALRTARAQAEARVNAMKGTLKPNERW